MYKILIIGAGQLGSRHLQGLLRSNITATIEVVEPNALSIKNAIERSKEIKFDKNKLKIIFFQNLNEISKNVDLCIIASTADKRFEIIMSLIVLSKVKYMLLEKVLFQNLSEYDIIEKLLSKNNIQTWVNCPRRTIKEYKDIKDQIEEGELITIKVTGSNWGLACNSIHFLDLFNFFIGESDFKITEKSQIETIQAKRNGFYELLGCLIIKAKSGSTLFLESFNSNTTIIELIITTKNYIYKIDEIKGTIEKIDLITKNTYQYNFNLPLQSEMSGSIAEDILVKGHCKLTPFVVSSRLHKNLLNNFVKHFRTELTHSGILCPIT
jgi:predicted dehydrogenase